MSERDRQFRDFHYLMGGSKESFAAIMQEERAVKFVLKDQAGKRVGPEFSRYQDAFNHRVSINGVGLRIVEL